MAEQEQSLRDKEKKLFLRWLLEINLDFVILFERIYLIFLRNF